MAETETEAPSQCKACGGTHKVLVSFTGADGEQHPREVPCPECAEQSAGYPTIKDTAIKELRDKLERVAWIAVLALTVAAIALLTGKHHEAGAFARAVKEEVE